MSVMRGGGRFVALVAILLLVSAACGQGEDEATQEEATGEPIIIGAAIAETGLISAFDFQPMVGARFAIEDINAAGGVLGRELELVIRDTKSDIDASYNVGLEVVNDGAEFCLVTVDFDFGSPQARACQDNDIPAMSIGAATLKFGPQAIGPLAFTSGTTTANEASIMAEWAFNEKGWRTAYHLADTTLEFSTTWGQNFELRWEELGGELIGKDTFKNDDPSFSAQITRLQQLSDQPDFIFTGSFPPGGATLLKQLRDAGIDTPVLGGDPWGGTGWHAAIPNLSDLFYAEYAAFVGNDAEEEINQNYERAVNATDTPENLTGFLFLGYVAVQAWAEAVERAGTTDGEAVVKELEGFRGEEFIAGIQVTFTDQFHITLERPMKVVEIQDGEHSVVTTWDPEKLPDDFV